MESHGARTTLLIGYVFLFLAFLAMLLLWEEDSSYWQIGIAYAFIGIGVGLAGTPASHSLTGSVPVRRAGMASGTADLQRDLGGAIMQSILGALLTAGYACAFASAIGSSSEADRSPPTCSPSSRSRSPPPSDRAAVPEVRRPDHRRRQAVLPARRRLGLQRGPGRDRAGRGAGLLRVPAPGRRAAAAPAVPRRGLPPQRTRPGNDAELTGMLQTFAQLLPDRARRCREHDPDHGDDADPRLGQTGPECPALRHRVGARRRRLCHPRHRRCAVPARGQAEDPDTAVGLVEVAIGALLVLLGVVTLVRRRFASEPQVPGWMNRVAHGLLARVRPGPGAQRAAQGVPPAVAAGLVLHTASLEPDATVVGVAFFTIVATSTVVVPVLLTLLAPHRMQPRLRGAHGWLTRQGPALTAVAMLVVGFLILLVGLGNL